MGESGAGLITSVIAIAAGALVGIRDGRSSIRSPRPVDDAGAIPSDVKNRVEAAPVRIGEVGRGRAGTIPLPHRCVPGAADSWPAIARDHLYIHDARVARINGLVDGPGTGSVRPGVA